nr:EAL domain-containing protein [Lysinibacillus timonensis]
MLNNQHYIHLQTIIQTSPDIIVLKDAEGRWLEANKSTLEIFGIGENYKGKTEEELGELYSQFKDLVPYFVASDQKAWEQAKMVEFEEIVPFKGEKRIFHVIKVPIFEESGKPNAILIIGRDITERLQTEQQYKMLFEENPAAVYTLDEKGYFKDVNKRATFISGYTKEELLNMSFHSLLVPEFLPMIEKNFSSAMEGVLQSSEVQIMRKDGEIRDVSLSATPISFYGAINGIQGVAIDITEKKRALQVAEEIQKSLRDLVRQQQGMIFKYIKVGEDFIHTICDGELAYKTGLTPEFVVGKSLEQIFEQEDAEVTLQYYERAWLGEEVDFEGKLANNSIVYLAALRPIFEDGKVVEVIGSVVDITKSKEAERALKESEERYRVIGEYSTDMILTIDSSFKITYASPSNENVLGYSSEYLIGKAMLSFIHPEEFQKVRSAMESVLTSQKSVSTLGRVKIQDETWIWVESTLSPVLEGDKVTSIVVVARNIAERKKLEDQLHYMAYHDSLTGLPNRRMFDKELEEQIQLSHEKNYHFALLYFDIDRFKIVNDTLGHNIGDLLLVEVSKRLKGQLPPNDLFARMGGDEFALIVKNVTETSYVDNLAEKILASFEIPFYIEDNEINITASIGISLYPKYSSDPKELMKQADIAMYHSKENGKNSYTFFEQINTMNKHDKLFLENDLRKALKNKELFIMYQPKVELNTNKIVGCEAFIRWNHPQRGIISPMEFIPIAEESGLIVPVGEWVIEEVLKQLNTWEIKVPVAINLSLKQVLSRNLIDVVRNNMQKYKIDPKWIEFELTESVMMNDLATSLSLINELQNEGIKIAIDDFGTGYSSLAHLKRFPLDVLKIDQSFVKDIPNDEEDMAIVSLIISMGKFLNLTIVAEGVETEEQLQYLKEQGCDIYQGYYFSRPLTNEDMCTLLRNEGI